VGRAFLLSHFSEADAPMGERFFAALRLAAFDTKRTSRAFSCLSAFGGKADILGEHQSPKSGSRCRTVAMPGLLIEELKAWRATQAQEPIAPRHSPRSRHSHLTPNMQADAAARLDVALRAAKKC
jgi:hypothetical protein